MDSRNQSPTQRDAPLPDRALAHTERLSIRFGKSFEAVAHGRLAIVSVVAIALLYLFWR